MSSDQFNNQLTGYPQPYAPVIPSYESIRNIPVTYHNRIEQQHAKENYPEIAIVKSMFPVLDSTQTAYSNWMNIGRKLGTFEYYLNQLRSLCGSNLDNIRGFGESRMKKELKQYETALKYISGQPLNDNESRIINRTDFSENLVNIHHNQWTFDQWLTTALEWVVYYTIECERLRSI
jgi:hypothetical protein